MKTRSNKHVLKAAKQVVADKFTIRLAELQGRLEEALEEGTSSTDIDDITQKIRAVQDEWNEWRVRSSKNKRKIGKRVEWTNRREQAPMKTIDRDALQDLRQTRKAQSKSTVGIDWLHEGALVIERGKSEMMIVTRISPRGKVECLKHGTTTWFRGTALRPASWMLED